MHLDQLVEQYEDEIVLIRYHSWWPSSDDPFYQFNPSEMAARINYYSIVEVTYLYIDGIVDAGSSWPPWDSLFQTRMEVPSPMEIEISGSYNEYSREVDLDISVTATDEITQEDLKFHCVVTESDIYWPAPNGLEYHNQTMRDMVPDALGESFYIENGETVPFEQVFSLDNTLVAENCDIVIIVQSDDSKEVLQAAKVRLVDLDETNITDNIDMTPSTFWLGFAYPNPFNASTVISYELPHQSQVTIDIYDILGRKIESLVNIKQPAGYYHVTWKAENQPSGTYFYRIMAGDYTETKKMVLLK